jgi:hypothetical protein
MNGWRQKVTTLPKEIQAESTPDFHPFYYINKK